MNNSGWKSDKTGNWKLEYGLSPWKEQIDYGHEYRLSVCTVWDSVWGRRNDANCYVLASIICIVTESRLLALELVTHLLYQHPGSLAR